MRQSATSFVGLTMPVFTAFGWTGEENALKFAFSQLEEFVVLLHARLPRTIQEKLPAFGLSQETQSVYLAASSDIESNVHIVFNARPMSFEIQLAITAKEVLNKAFKRAESDLSTCHRLITELGPGWTLRIQQMQVDEESTEAGHYQDLYKDDVGGFDEETANDVISRAAYLNGEDQWLIPFYVSRRIPSEQAASMGSAILKVMSEQVANLMPLIQFLTEQASKRVSKPKTKTAIPAEKIQAVVDEENIDPEEGFQYLAKLKPLHLRRGFINLTPEHWPYFAVNSRSTTRDVTVYYDGIYDKDNSIWRLVPDDQARLVLSPAVHQWLEDHFDTNDQLLIVAKKLDADEIQLSLKAIA